jgi:Holliday junction resolvase RusA-like endonuclease
MSDCHHFTLFIPGPVQAKGRPRFNMSTGRTYTPTRTKIAENDVRAVWREAGEPRIPERMPVAVRIYAVLDRPQTHYRANGELSAAGRRSIFPVKKPDADNLAKLLLDSLNGLGWADDAQVVTLEVQRRWATPFRRAGTTVRVKVQLEQDDPAYWLEQEAA